MLSRMLMGLRRFMYGRYGSDSLNFWLCISAIVLSLLSRIPVLWFLAILMYIPFGIVIYRTLSRDIPRRQQENMKFLQFKGRMQTLFTKKKTQFEQRKTYKFFKCPTCKQRIRIPKGRGKVNVCCPKCKNHFVKKT